MAFIWTKAGKDLGIFRRCRHAAPGPSRNQARWVFGLPRRAQAPPVAASSEPDASAVKGH